MAVRFLHTADWQIGMRRWFLGQEGGPRFADARLNAVRRLGEVAADQGCEFVVVAGDVFESNELDRGVVGRLREAVASIPVPVVLLPGNHDHLGPGSIYDTRDLTERAPDNLLVLRDAEPVEIRPGVEVVGAPWRSKAPTTDLVTEAAVAAGRPAPGVTRVVVGHGGVDTQAQKFHLRAADLDRLVHDGYAHYVALGDRHSTTAVGSTGRVWYSGACEVTDFVEDDPGNVLVVELDDDRCEVIPHRVGTWRFERVSAELRGGDDVARLAEQLDRLTPKDRCVVKLDVSGALTLAERRSYDELVDDERPLFAAIIESERTHELVTVPAETDFDDLGVTGFVADALADLREAAESGGEEGEVAAEAIRLLVQLVGEPR